MNIKLTASILIFSTFISCKKSGDDTSDSTTTVKYQVTSSNTTGQFMSAYNNNAGQYISGLYKADWETSFNPTNKPFTATLNVSPYNAVMTVTLKIFVNNTVVKEVTGQISNTAGTTQSIQYVVN